MQTAALPANTNGSRTVWTSGIAPGCGTAALCVCVCVSTYVSVLRVEATRVCVRDPVNRQSVNFRPLICYSVQSGMQEIKQRHRPLKGLKVGDRVGRPRASAKQPIPPFFVLDSSSRRTRQLVNKPHHDGGVALRRCAPLVPEPCP